MFVTSRRAVIVGLMLSGFAPSLHSRPDMVLYNGKIWTGNPNFPEATALAVSGRHIIAVGEDADILDLAGADARKIDLGRKRVLPGFNDAHAHLAWAGIERIRNVATDLSDLDAIKTRLRERAAQTPPGTAVIGFLYDDGKTPRPLNRADLDEVSREHPVMVQHRGGHTMFVNTKAFEMAGVDEETPDPPGGTFGRDEQGRLSGLVVDNAYDPFGPLFPGEASADEFARGIADAARLFASHGVTSTCDAGANPTMLEGYENARRAGELITRVYCHIDRFSLDELVAAGISTGFGDELLRIGALKLMADGSISERSALLSLPYNGRGDYRGVQVQTPDEMYELASQAHRAGWQIGIHGNGDVAIDQVLSLFERLQREMPRHDPRFRIEHCTVLNDDLIRRIAALDALPILFGGYVYFHGAVMHFYGEERLRHMFALRSLLDAGIPAVSSSDYTASPPNPMLWLQSEVTRTDSEGRPWGLNQRVGIEEALKTATANGAYASFEEDRKGVLAPGMLADLAVWKSDPLAADPFELATIEAERTMMGGAWTYES